MQQQQQYRRLGGRLPASAVVAHSHSNSTHRARSNSSSSSSDGGGGGVTRAAAVNTTTTTPVFAVTAATAAAASSFLCGSRGGSGSSQQPRPRSLSGGRHCTAAHGVSIASGTGGGGGRRRRRGVSTDLEGKVEALRRTRLRFMFAILALLLTVLLLLLVVIGGFIYGPSLYEERMRQLLATDSNKDDVGGGGVVAGNAPSENVMVRKVLDGLGFGRGGEHQQRLRQQRELDAMAAAAKHGKGRYKNSEMDLASGGGGVGEIGGGGGFGQASLHGQLDQVMRLFAAKQAELARARKTVQDAMRGDHGDGLLNDVFKINPADNNMPVGDGRGGRGGGDGGGGGENSNWMQQHHQHKKKTRQDAVDAADLAKRAEQLQELAAWMAAVGGSIASVVDTTDAGVKNADDDDDDDADAAAADIAIIPSGGGGGGVAQGYDASTIAAAATHGPLRAAAALAVGNGVQHHQIQQEEDEHHQTLAVLAANPAYQSRLAGMATEAQVSLTHFAQFYQRLRRSYSDEAVGMFLSALDVNVKSNSKENSNSGSGGVLDFGDAAARAARLGFTAAAGAGRKEHKRLRPMDEIELLKYRRAINSGELGGGREPFPGNNIDRNNEGGSNDADGLGTRLASFARNRQLKYALYSSAPSVLNRNYYFPLQRFELAFPYSRDTARNMDAWFTPVAAELLLFTGAAGDDGDDKTAAGGGGGGAFFTNIINDNNVNGNGIIRRAISPTPPTTSMTGAASFRFLKNALIATADPRLPVSLLQSELRYLSTHRLHMAHQHATALAGGGRPNTANGMRSPTEADVKERNSIVDRFTNKENNLEGVGNIAPLFASLATNGAAGSRNNFNIFRLIDAIEGDENTINSDDDDAVSNDDDEEHEEGGGDHGAVGAAAAAAAGEDIMLIRDLMLEQLNIFMIHRKQAASDETSIFVSFAAFRDAEAPRSIYDLFVKAKNPARVFVGVADQFRDGDPSPLIDLAYRPPLPCYFPTARRAEATRQRTESIRRASAALTSALSGGGGQAKNINNEDLTNAHIAAVARVMRGAQDRLQEASAVLASMLAATESTTSSNRGYYSYHSSYNSNNGGGGGGNGRGDGDGMEEEEEDGDRHYEFLAQQRAYGTNESVHAEKNLQALLINNEYNANNMNRRKKKNGNGDKPNSNSNNHLHQDAVLLKTQGKIRFFNPYFLLNTHIIIENNQNSAAVAVADALGRPIVPQTRAGDFTQRLCFITDNVRVRRIRATHSYGPTFGRYMAMLLYRGETMTLVIDSHNRFDPFWDSLGVNAFLKYGDERTVLSHYPDSYPYAKGVSPRDADIAAEKARRANTFIYKTKTRPTNNNEAHADADDDADDATCLPPLDHDDEEEWRQGGNSFVTSHIAYLCRAHFLPNYGYLRLSGILTRDTKTPYNVVSKHLAPYYKPAAAQAALDRHRSPAELAAAQAKNFKLPQPWIAGGFLLSSFHVMREVPFDPHLPQIFDGEEVLYGMRLFTHGFTIFSPTVSLCYHFYGRENAPKIWNEAAATWGVIQEQSRRRVQYLVRAFKSNTTALIVDPQGWTLTGIQPNSNNIHGNNRNRGFTIGGQNRMDAVALVEADRYGMGSVRSVDDWYDFAGADRVTYERDGRFCGVDAKK